MAAKKKSAKKAAKKAAKVAEGVSEGSDVGFQRPPDKASAGYDPSRPLFPGEAREVIARRMRRG